MNKGHDLMIVDKYDNEFIVGAIIKMDHFIGAHGRKHYMYKLVTEIKDDKVWFAHLDGLRVGDTIESKFRLDRHACAKFQIIYASYKDCRILKKGER